MIEPDIAGNVGTILRTAACFDLAIHIVEPCGFAFGDRSLKRAGMDYAAQAQIHRHADVDAFLESMALHGHRLVLMTTRGSEPLNRFSFTGNDVIMLGSEGSGAPQAIHEAAHARIHIPLMAGLRSLNVAMAGAFALGQALSQTDNWPSTTTA